VEDGAEYHWQFRTIDQSNLAGPWAEFGGNSSGAADFRVAIPDPPAVPSAAGQFKANGISPIAQGGSTNEATVVFSALLADADIGATLRFEIELRPVGTPFSGSATDASAAVPANTRATLAAAVSENTQYHWQYRSIDETGRASAWTPFGTNSEAEADFVTLPAGGGPTAPAAPTPGQFRSDGTTAIAVGGTTTELSVVFASTLTDTDAGASIRLEIELRPVGQALSGSPTHASAAVGSGARASVSATVANATQYHWAARAMDETGRASAWVAFGGNADGAADFAVQQPPPPSPPGPPTALQQYRADGVTAIAVGDTTSEAGVVLEAEVSDADAGDVLRLEIEARPVATPFSNVATHSAANLASGTRGRAAVAITAGGWHWQARACDATACGAWVAFGGNAETDNDFVKP
jgi:hypothetical protein